MSGHVGWLASPDEYGYCSRACPARLGKETDAACPQVKSTLLVLHPVGPQAGLPRPHTGASGEMAVLLGLDSKVGTPASRGSKLAPVSPYRLLSPHQGMTTKDEVTPLSPTAGAE